MPLVTSSSVQGNLYRQATEPSSAITGDVWVDTDNGRIYTYNGSSWVQQTAGTGLQIQTVANQAALDSLTFTANQIVQLTSTGVMLYGQAAAATPAGAIYYNFDGNAFYTWKNPALDENFTSYADQTAADASWPTSETARLRVNVTNDNLAFDTDTGVADSDACVHDLGATVSNTLWVLRFKIVTTTLTAETTAGLQTSLYVGLSDSDQTAIPSSAQDAILLLFQTFNNAGSFYKVMDCNGTAPNATATDATFTTAYATGTIYVQIKRTSATAYTVGIYSDSGYTTLTEEQSGTTSSAVTALRYVKAMTLSENTGTGKLVGTIDDIKFYNGVSSV